MAPANESRTRHGRRGERHLPTSSIDLEPSVEKCSMFRRIKQMSKRRVKDKMPPNRPGSPLAKPLTTLAIPGMYLVYKYNEYKRQRQEQHRRKVTERELDHLNHKIDKLLSKIDEHDLETAVVEEEECVICLGAKATMQTYPCSHRVVCRKCFIKTIQVAVSQRCLPLRCVICRTRILKLRQLLQAQPGNSTSSNARWLPQRSPAGNPPQNPRRCPPPRSPGNPGPLNSRRCPPPRSPLVLNKS